MHPLYTKVWNMRQKEIFREGTNGRDAVRLSGREYEAHYSYYVPLLWWVGRRLIIWGQRLERAAS